LTAAPYSGFNETMPRLCATVRSGSACLAALLALLTGSPHVDCLCPNGRVMPFCFSFCGGGPSCCCGGACCRNEGDRPGAHPRVRACCAHGRPQNAAPHGQLGHAPCKKSLVEAEVRALTAEGAAQHLHAAVARLGCVPGAETISAPAVAGNSPLTWQSHHLPPPTDRVVVFQHFII
jgi:hypothetical protein